MNRSSELPHDLERLDKTEPVFKRNTKRMGRPPGISNYDLAERRRRIALYISTQNASVPEAIAQFGSTSYTVKKAMKEYGVTARRHNKERVFPKDTAIEILASVMNAPKGTTLRDVASFHKVTVKRVVDVFNFATKCGIPGLPTTRKRGL